MSETVAAGAAIETTAGRASVPGGWRRALAWPIRVLILAATIWLCIGPPAVPVLQALVPVQRAVFAALMPEFAVRAFAVEASGAHVKLRAETVNSSYLVVRGRAAPPGFAFSVETPARVALAYAALIVGGMALTVPAGARSLLPTLAVAAVAIFAMTIVSPCLVLAGSQWGLVVTAFAEASLASWLVAAADFLVHGGGFALSIGAVVVAGAAARGPRARSSRPQTRRAVSERRS